MVFPFGEKDGGRGWGEEEGVRWFQLNVGLGFSLYMCGIRGSVVLQIPCKKAELGNAGIIRDQRYRTEP
jgi:hypothetical protein